MTTPITFYLSATTSASMSTANRLFDTVGSPSVQENLNLVGTGTKWGQIHSQTNAATWPALTSIGNPDGNGWFYDLNTLDGQVFGAGSWSGSMRSGLKTTGTTMTVVFTIRAWRYHSGTYTKIVTLLSPTQNYSSASAVTIALASVTGTGGIVFATGDLLYIDVWGNITVNTGGITTQQFRSGNLSTDASGGTGDANQSITSPGFDIGLVTIASTFSDIAAPIEVLSVLASPTLTSVTTSLDTQSLLAWWNAQESTLTQDATVVTPTSNVAMILTNIAETTALLDFYTASGASPVMDPSTSTDVLSMLGNILLPATTTTIVEATSTTRVNVVADTTGTLDTVSLFTLLSATTTTKSSDAPALVGLDFPSDTDTTTDKISSSGSSPVPIDPTVQMLYATLQAQYEVIRASSSNAHIQLMAIVYYCSTTDLIFSEYNVPGEIDILLIGESIAQLHVLKTVNDVIAFLAAYP